MVIDCGLQIFNVEMDYLLFWKMIANDSGVVSVSKQETET